jgi:thioredoxin 1
MFLPVFKQVSETEDTKMVMVNIDENQEAAAEAGVTGIPSIIMYKGNSEVARMTGFRSPDELQDFINKNK